MNIIGHEKIADLLNRSITRGAIAHAYLFSGQKHLGKFTMAFEFAEKLVGSKAEINPDLIIIKPETEEKKGITRKLDIKIEQIRELQHQLSLTSQGGRYKVVIIDDADRLNKMAQNALLKTLEEPNEKVVLILVSQDDKKLLATILSRCQRIKFGPVSEEDLKKHINVDRKDGKKLIFWSLGRPGLLLCLINDKNELDFREKTLVEFKELPMKNITEKFSLAESMSKNTGNAAKKLNLWLVILREALFEKNLGIADRKKYLALMENINKSLELIKETNSNARLVLENLFLRF